jgi:hypothetical protein
LQISAGLLLVVVDVQHAHLRERASGNTQNQHAEPNEI